ncbi:MAG: spermidine/putrescine ABC transporter, partial [Bacteroidales bacterium]|nr:spermidine/putrescine ABC transporter [Candidatus Hennigimonas equi]
MKRFLYLALAATLLCSCNDNRENVLKVYNWSNYIGDGVIDDFEQWYKEKTGEDIEVIYQTFDINETMLSKIEKGHEDFDVVCPSDYIIERMLNS